MLTACGSAAPPAGSPSAAGAASSAAASPTPATSAGAAPSTKPPASTSASAAAKPSASPSKALSMNAAYATPGSNDLPMWVAYEKGLFKQSGIDVNMSYVEGSVVAIPALTAGELAIVDAAPATSVQAQLKGADTVALSMHVPYSNVHLMALPEIKTLQDLKGKAIGSTKAGGADDVVIRAILKREGLTPDKDVSITYLGTQPAELAALQQGVVRATMSPAPYNYAAEKIGAHQLWGEKFPYPVDGMLSTRKYVAAHQDETVAFMKGYVLALRFIRSNADESKRILGQYSKQTDQSVLDTAYQDVLDSFQDNPEPKLESIASVLPLFPGGEGRNPADFVDAGPLHKALEQLGS